MGDVGVDGCGRQPSGGRRGSVSVRLRTAPGPGLRSRRATHGRRQRIERMVRSRITVTAVSAPTVSLATDDGWTRDVDTTNVVITRDGQPITSRTSRSATPSASPRPATRRQLHGHGIEVQPALTQGTVATVGTAGFTVSAGRWHAGDRSGRGRDPMDIPRRGTPQALMDSSSAARVAAQGSRAADGSIDATAVAAERGTATVPSEPATSPAPEASSAG